jgi:hypothetical protein
MWDGTALTSTQVSLYVSYIVFSISVSGMKRRFTGTNVCSVVLKQWRLKEKRFSLILCFNGERYEKEE